jgi:hypothetical protein
MVAVNQCWRELESILISPVAAEFGYLDQSKFNEGLLSLKNGNVPHLARILRALSLELWLRDLVGRGLVHTPRPLLIPPPGSATRAVEEQSLRVGRLIMRRALRIWEGRTMYLAYTKPAITAMNDVTRAVHELVKNGQFVEFGSGRQRLSPVYDLDD